MNLESRKNNPLSEVSEYLECEWTPLILQTLQKGNQRYSQIEFALHGITPSELSTRLRNLLAHGMVSRHVKSSQPTMTNYELTEKGKALQNLLQAIASYNKIASQ